jgi:hypothetical protein
LASSALLVAGVALIGLGLAGGTARHEPPDHRRPPAARMASQISVQGRGA